MTLGGKLELRFGPRATATLGSVFLVGSTLAASRFQSVWSMALGFGLCFGFGGGLTYTVPVVCGFRWDSSHKGWVSGVVLSAFGMSSLFFNQIQAAIVNPHNLKPDVQYQGKRYFGPGPVTEAVPGLFVKLAAIYTALAVVGVLLVRDPAYKKIDDDGLSPARAEGGGGDSSSSPSQLRRRLYDGETGTGDDQGEDGGEEEEEEDKTPRQMLQTPQAWHLSLCFLLGSLSGLVTLSTYKSYGVTTFVDDHFFSYIVGSIAAAANAGGRLLWGAMSDRIGAYATLRAASLIQAVALFAWGFTVDPLDSKWAFAACVGFVCLCHGGGFAVYPALTADLFGKTNAASNFGVIFLGYGVMSLAGLAILPRLSAALSPLNYALGAIALGAAVNITLLDRCYPAHHLHNGNGGRKAQEPGAAQGSSNGGHNDGFVLLPTVAAGGASSFLSAASLN